MQTISAECLTVIVLDVWKLAPTPISPGFQLRSVDPLSIEPIQVRYKAKEYHTSLSLLLTRIAIADLEIFQ